MNDVLKQTILDSKDWSSGQRFGQFIFNALSLPNENRDDTAFVDRLFYIENDVLIAELEEWLRFINKQKETNEKTPTSTNI